MVTIEETDDDSTVGSRQFHPGIGTQDAADALMSFGFGAASGEGKMTPEQVFKQTQEKKHRYYNKLAGNITGMSDEEDEEDEMIDLMTGWNAGEQLARQQQVASPMRNTTSETSRRVTLSNQKQKTVVKNPYKKSFTTNRRTKTSSLAIRDKENPIPTVVSKKTASKRRLQLPLHGLATSSTAVASRPTAAASSSKDYMSYARTIHADKNAFEVFQDDQQEMVSTATKDTPDYRKKLERIEKMFFGTVAKHTKDKDDMLYNLCTTMVDIPGNLDADLQFYHVLGGEKQPFKKAILSRACNIFTLNIRNTKTGQPLASNTHGQYVKEAFIAFNRKGIRYNQYEFTEEGGFTGVAKADFNEKRKKDPNFGKKNSKPEYDEYGDEKYNEMLRSGKLKPWENSVHMLMVITYSLPAKFGFRGRSEITGCQWSYLRLKQYDQGEFKGLRYVEAAPRGGFDKTHQLSLGNTTERIEITTCHENDIDPNCPIKLLFAYRDLCFPDQQFLLCHHNPASTTKYKYSKNKKVGPVKITEWIKEISKMPGLKDFDKCTPHRRRDIMITNMYSNINTVGVQQALNQGRHTKERSAQPYNHMNATHRGNLSSALNGGIRGVNSLFAPEIAAQKKMAAATKKDSNEEKKPSIDEKKPPIEEKKQKAIIPVQSITTIQATVDLTKTSEAALPPPAVMKRDRVSDQDHFQQECKRLKVENTNLFDEKKKLLEEKKILTEENNSLIIENQQVELQSKYDINMKTFELKAALENLKEKKEENQTLKDENISLKQDLQHTKEEKKNLQRVQEQRESEQRLLQLFQQQQQQPKCAIM